jgi:hypothetical protein
MSTKPYSSTLRVPYPGGKQANFVKQALEGDDELQPHRIEKTFAVEGNELVV